MSKEKGAASILIDLSNGNITVYHGTEQGAILLSKKNVPEGTWNAIWEHLRSIKEPTQRVFMWTDKTGRGFKSPISLDVILGDKDNDDELKEWAQGADIGDYFDSRTAHYSRIE